MTQPLLNTAIILASSLHAGQTDKGGNHYILHLLRVMLAMDTEEEMIVAVLHDIVEDTVTALSDLRLMGFPDSVIEAIDCLTKRTGETRIQSAHRAGQNPLARKVKLADNADNMDISRILNPTEKDFARIEQYKLVRDILLSYGDASDSKTEFNKENYINGLTDAKQCCESALGVMGMIYEYDPAKLSVAQDAIGQVVQLIDDDIAMVK